MTIDIGTSQQISAVRRRMLRRPALRPLFRAAFWATLAYVSWTAFRIGQQRLQPDAIASSVPGFLSRLILRPLELVMHGMVWVEPGPAVLQAAIAMTILAISFHMSARPGRSLGGDRI